MTGINCRWPNLPAPGPGWELLLCRMYGVGSVGAFHLVHFISPSRLIIEQRSFLPLSMCLNWLLIVSQFVHKHRDCLSTDQSNRPIWNPVPSMILSPSYTCPYLLVSQRENPLMLLTSFIIIITWYTLTCKLKQIFKIYFYYIFIWITFITFMHTIAMYWYTTEITRG